MCEYWRYNRDSCRLCKSDGTLYTTGIIYGSGSYVATGYYNGTDAPTAYTLYELVDWPATLAYLMHKSLSKGDRRWF